MKLNWVTLKVRDLEKSLSFYTGILKLEIAARFGTADRPIVMLGEKDQAKIELICEPSPIDNPGKGVTIGLEPENLDQMVYLLAEHGYPVTGPISPNPQIRFFFVRDPDGYAIQLVEQK